MLILINWTVNYERTEKPSVARGCSAGCQGTVGLAADVDGIEKSQKDRDKPTW
jgi:hypothetical protein